MTTDATKTYVLDTSVLLADPQAMSRFGSNLVVLPLVVINELEAKRNDPELGYNARRALRELESLRVRHGSLADGVPINGEGGRMRVEINHQDMSGLPEAFRNGSNDHRVLAVGTNLIEDGASGVVIVSKDLPLRLKASVAGLNAEEFMSEQVPDSGWTGVVTLKVEASVVSRMYDHGWVPLAELGDKSDGLLLNSGLVLKAGRQSVLARVVLRDGEGMCVERTDASPELFGVRPKSAEQHLAMAALRDPSIAVVSLGGRAGTGKTLLALAAGLDAVMERKEFKRIMVFRPVYSVGGQDLGFVPGTLSEKMADWSLAIFDALGRLGNEYLVEAAKELIDIQPLTHLRGRSICDAWIVVDESQNLEVSVLTTAMTRLGEGSKIVLCHDMAQRDNLHVARHEGMVPVIEALKGEALFSHTTLMRSERSAVAEMVTRLLDGN